MRRFSRTDGAGDVHRQAWEGQVREAIEQVVTARREEIDWVLSDRQQDTSADISPDTLRNRLTSRYYRLRRKLAGVSQQHSLEKEDSLSGILDQLTLMADARQSPLIALTDTLAWQAAEAGKPWSVRLAGEIGTGTV